jgi:hypothetical protein
MRGTTELTARQKRAAAIFQGSPNTAPQALSDSILGDLSHITAQHFASAYKAARGVEIDPIYVRALGFDILCMLAAFNDAQARGETP